MCNNSQAADGDKQLQEAICGLAQKAAEMLGIDVTAVRFRDRREPYVSIQVKNQDDATLLSWCLLASGLDASPVSRPDRDYYTVLLSLVRSVESDSLESLNN